MASSDLSATTTITFEQLTKYFHLPINDVAKELGICATMLKKICRKNGIPRWPHRKIKSLNKMIENLEASLQNNASEAEECIRQEINILKNKKSLIMKNPSILVQGGSNKRASVDPEGKPSKKLRASEEDEMPVATITIPKSSSALPPSSSNSLSINQLLTPTHPFSTPLTSYLLEEKDEKDSPRTREEQMQLQLVRPPSPSSAQHYYKSQQQQQHLQQASRYYLPTHTSMPQDFHGHGRSSVDFLTSASYVQQQPQPQPQPTPDGHYVLPKLNFSPSAAQQPATSYISSSPPKYRPPSPTQSAAPYPPQSADGYGRHAPAHFFHHYHPQLPSPAGQYNGNKMQQQYSQPLPQQPQASLSHQQSPVVLRWVMEYDKPKK